MALAKFRCQAMSLVSRIKMLKKVCVVYALGSSSDADGDDDDGDDDDDDEYHVSLKVNSSAETFSIRGLQKRRQKIFCKVS